MFWSISPCSKPSSSSRYDSISSIVPTRPSLTSSCRCPPFDFPNLPIPAGRSSESLSSWKKNANSSPMAAKRTVRYSPVTSDRGTKYVEPGRFADHLLNGGVYGSSRGMTARSSDRRTRLRSYSSVNRCSRDSSVSSRYSSGGNCCGRRRRKLPSSRMTHRFAVATASALEDVRPTRLIITCPPPVSGPAAGA